METYDLIYNLTSLTSAMTIMVGLLYILLSVQRYFRSVNNNRILKFTQEEVKDKKKEIGYLRKNTPNLEISNSVIGIYWDFEGNDQQKCLYEIFNLYNELAVGINEGLYNELYVKMVLGNEMMSFYKKYGSNLVSSIENDTLFMPLELLLKKWDSDESPRYTIRNHRRYF